MTKARVEKTSPATRREQAAIVRTIGARMKQARELCNLSQSVAARRLGYANSSKLSKIEGAMDSLSVPLWLILRASKVYEVSVDFLFGASDDWDIGTRMTREREVSVWLWEAMEKVRLRDMEALRRLHDKVAAMEEGMGLALATSQDVSAALARFVELNPEFNEMRAGSRLVGAVDRASESAAHVKARMDRFRVECALAAADTHQLSLAL